MTDIDVIENYLTRRGLPVPDAAWRGRLAEWRAWYEGDVADFHRYSVWNGISRVGRRRAGLNMAKTVCEDWASLLLNERVKLCAGGEGERLGRLLAENRFGVECAALIETAFALGTAAFSEYLDSDGVPRLDRHDAFGIYPLSVRGGTVRECAFCGTETENGREKLYLRLYLLDPDGTYRIENVWLDPDSGVSLPPPAGIAAAVHTGIREPLFQLVSPNIVSNIRHARGMGISVFANALPALKGIDTAYDSFVNEFLLGRKRLMIPASMARIQLSRDGDVQPLFDPQDTTFVAYTPAEDQSDGFHDLSPEIRAEAHLTGIRAFLDVLSFKCGLGTGRYDFDRSNGLRTATEVISEQSDLYQSKVRHEHLLRGALISLARALLALDGVREGTAEITVQFDDSIIQDRSAIAAEARADVAAGLMSRKRYLTEILGLSVADAEKELTQIEKERKDINGRNA